MSLSGWRRAITWAGAAAFVYVGSRLPLYGVDVPTLVGYFNRNRPSLLVLLYDRVFQGGLYHGAVLALGIMPYLTARIYMWVFRSKNRKLTRWLTAGLALAQSVGYAAFIRRIPGAVTSPGTFMTTTILSLTAASLITMWFGEKLTEPDEPDDIDDSPLRGEIGEGSFEHAPESSIARPDPDPVRR